MRMEKTNKRNEMATAEEKTYIISRKKNNIRLLGMRAASGEAAS